MSRTDRHRPVWVQARDMVPGTRVFHDHVLGPCDLEEDHDVWSATWPRSNWRWPSNRSRCYYHLSFYRTLSGKAWPHYRRKVYKRIYAHRERADWRRLEHKLLTWDPWDVEDPLFRPSKRSIRWDEW